MPELIEAEMYRRALDPLRGAEITRVELLDEAYVRPRGVSASDVHSIVGSTLLSTRRHGKLVLLDLGHGADRRSIGLHFGMTGRLFVDGAGPIDALVYSSERKDAAWDRVRIHFGEHLLAVNDPRRLGALHLDPADGHLGPDAASITPVALERVVRGKTAAIKATLLNQRRIAGLGNLLGDEILWRASIHPDRESGQLREHELEVLAHVIVETIGELTARGGSHTGDTFDHRQPGGRCPRDDAEMHRLTVGGRTSWFCSEHQQ